MTIKAIFLAAIVALFSPAAFADDAAPAPDKSQYNLFNPVPDDQLRSFSTDRPSKSNSPTTVDAGHFQYEADIVNWTYDRYNASQTTLSDVIVGDPVLKAGLTQNTDLELGLAPVNFIQTHDRVTNEKNTASGFGDVYTRVKFNLLGNEGGDYALALVPYVKAPTAAHNIGNNHWEGGGYAPFSIALPQDWTLTLQTEMDFLENAALNGTHTNFSNLINFEHPLFDPSLTGEIEFWSDVDNDAGMQPQYTGDFSLAWQIGDNAQLDGGVNLGLNKAAPDFQPYLGISQRF